MHFSPLVVTNTSLKYFTLQVALQTAPLVLGTTQTVEQNVMHVTLAMVSGVTIWDVLVILHFVIIILRNGRPKYIF